MSITWCVAHTQNSKELVAQQHLLAQGYEVYLPRFKKICRHARKTEEKLIPLFPRYIFLGIDLKITSWRKVNGTRGISHLLMSNDLKPATIPQRVIDDLRFQETPEGIVSLSSLVTFVKGQKLRIIEGVFKDQLATFELFDDKSRVQLLLAFMGRDLSITLPAYAVEAAQ